VAKPLTTAAAAKQLGIQPASVRAACRRGKLKFKLFGDRLLIKQEDVDTYAEKILGRFGRK